MPPKDVDPTRTLNPPIPEDLPLPAPLGKPQVAPGRPDVAAVARERDEAAAQLAGVPGGSVPEYDRRVEQAILDDMINSQYENFVNNQGAVITGPRDTANKYLPVSLWT